MKPDLAGCRTALRSGHLFSFVLIPLSAVAAEKSLQPHAVVLMIVILLLSMPVGRAECADWVLVLENEEAMFYADRDSVLKNKDQVKEARELSVLKNHKEIRRYLEVVEYDCRDRKRRLNQVLTYYHTGRVALKTDNNAPWENIGQETMAGVFFKFVCGQQR